MSDFLAAWTISRGRFDDSIFDLSQSQLNYRLQPNSLSLGEAALHVAGAETWFISQLLDREGTDFEHRLMKCATDGVVNDSPFPFSEAEITPELVRSALSGSRRLAEQILSGPPPEALGKQIKSALGPIIDCQGALARLAFHPAYHQGQAHLIRLSPNFPS